MANWKEFLEGSNRDVIERFSWRDRAKPRKPTLMIVDSSVENALNTSVIPLLQPTPCPGNMYACIFVILALGPHFLTIWKRFCGHRPSESEALNHRIPDEREREREI
jgi:hypothetical protein